MMPLGCRHGDIRLDLRRSLTQRYGSVADELRLVTFHLPPYLDTPVHLLIGSDVRGLLAGSERFKTGAIKELKGRYPNIRLAIGDKVADANAYVANNIRSIYLPDINWKEDDAEYYLDRMAAQRSAAGQGLCGAGRVVYRGGEANAAGFAPSAAADLRLDHGRPGPPRPGRPKHAVRHGYPVPSEQAFPLVFEEVHGVPL